MAALVGLCLLATSACSVDQAMRAETYTVARGDTLSEIAQRYGLNWRELARWNRIKAPYRLDVGQTLYLKPFPPIDYAQVNPVGTVPARRSADTRSQSRAPAAPVADTASRRRSEPAQPAPAPRATTNSRADRAARSTEIARATEESEDEKPTITAGGPNQDGWQWPATGKLYRTSKEDERGRGIEIAGSAGSAISAASSGTVAYNGTGLKGYGQLIIIKHDEHYLSAYGFVKNSRVTQGQTVTAGQQIAEMGLGPGNKPLLHFEIRRDGKPIDPEKRLPPR